MNVFEENETFEELRQAVGYVLKDLPVDVPANREIIISRDADRYQVLIILKYSTTYQLLIKFYLAMGWVALMYEGALASAIEAEILRALQETPSPPVPANVILGSE